MCIVEFKSVLRRTLVLLSAVVVTLATSRTASAQGCILIRDSAPVIGSMSSSYLQPGQWELDVSFRDSTADQHYSLDVLQVARTTLGTNVVNKQRQLLVNVTRSLTPRISMSAAVPYIDASWSVPSPTTPTPGPRAVEHGKGIGDVSISGRSWLLDPTVHSARNISLGLGLKIPTGKADATDTFVDIKGLNSATKPVDQSVQPGDGGWGVQVEMQGFTQIRRMFVFGSANYLINPRNMNDTASILVNLGVPSTTVPEKNVNSVPDQYIVRAGIGVPLAKGFGASIAWRMEGVPRYDLIGRSDGFRRPGDERYFEPAITYSRGKSTFQVNMPIGYYRYRAPDPYTSANGDATFPGVVAVGSYSYRFGAGHAHHDAMPDPMPAQPGARQDQ